MVEQRRSQMSQRDDGIEVKPKMATKHVRMSDPGPALQRRSVAIPIKVNGEDLRSVSPSPSVTDIERQMEAEVEKALRDYKPWESRVKGITQSSLHIRPSSQASDVSQQRTPRRQRVQSTPVTPVVPREIPEIDVIRREDTSLLDTSAESLDEEAKQPLYSRCPATGRKIFRLEFDVQGYGEENISVRVSSGRLIVHAVQRETVDGRKTTNEFSRKIKLPTDVDSKRLRCVYTDDGKLVVESPVLPAAKLHADIRACSSLNGSLQSVPSKRQALNTPFVKNHPESQSGLAVHIHVEVGRVFQSDDVIVKVRGHDKVIVSAEKEEVKDKSRLTANLSREFDLPERILPQTLKAGLTLDGVLKVVAHVEKKPVNGLPTKEGEIQAESSKKNGSGSAEEFV